MHNRMPVILEPKDYERWLTRDESKCPLLDLLRPLLAEEMKATEVSQGVGNVKNNSPELLNGV
jgi:putative SOS response-associated peptidase YedK